jgi:hypothetical protein
MGSGKAEAGNLYHLLRHMFHKVLPRKLWPREPGNPLEGLGKLYHRIGETERARENFTTATKMYRDMEMGFWLDQGEGEMAKFGYVEPRISSGLALLSAYAAMSSARKEKRATLSKSLFSGALHEIVSAFRDDLGEGLGANERAPSTAHYRGRRWCRELRFHELAKSK